MHLRKIFAEESHTAHELISLIVGLPDSSLYVAMKRGGEDYIGWSADRIILSHIYDAINNGSTATLVGAGVKKPPKFDLYPRPWEKKPKEDKPVTVKDLYAIMSSGGGKGLRNA